MSSAVGRAAHVFPICGKNNQALMDTPPCPACVPCLTENDSFLFCFPSCRRYTRSTRQWVLLSGSTADIQPVYNTRGVTSASTTPGSRYHVMAAVDPASGLMYMYGGITSSGCRGDLFSFSPLTFLWTFIAGTTSLDTIPAYAAGRGVAQPGNSTAGGRNYCSTWFIGGKVFIWGATGLQRRNDM
jgi:hypothetical protein